MVKNIRQSSWFGEGGDFSVKSWELEVSLRHPSGMPIRQSDTGN